MKQIGIWRIAMVPRRTLNKLSSEVLILTVCVGLVCPGVVRADGVGQTKRIQSITNVSKPDAKQVSKANQPLALFLLGSPWPTDGSEAAQQRAPQDIGNDNFDSAQIGEDWSGKVDAVDLDSKEFYWQLLKAPAGLTLKPAGEVLVGDKGEYHSLATLHWMPGKDALAQNEVTVRVVDGHGHAMVRTFYLPVSKGSHSALSQMVEESTKALPVGSNILDVNQLSKTYTMPAPKLLQPLAAFHLELGGGLADSPVSVTVPVQAGFAKRGDEVVFLRHGTRMVPVPQDSHTPAVDSILPTWWLVGAGYIGFDGKIHTDDSQNWLLASGDYVACRVLPATQVQSVELTIPQGQWLSFDGLNVSIAGGENRHPSFDSELIGELVGASSSLTEGDYRWGFTVFESIHTSELLASGIADFSDALPRKYFGPWTHVKLPEITGIHYDAKSNKLVFSAKNILSKPFMGRVYLSILSANGQVSQRLLEVPAVSDAATVSIKPPTSDIGIGDSVGFQLQREIPFGSVNASGLVVVRSWQSFSGNELFTSTLLDSISFDYHSLRFVDAHFLNPSTQAPSHHVSFKAVSKIDLLDQLGKATYDAFSQSVKVQPAGLSSDGSRCFLAGMGIIYEFDTVTGRALRALTLPDEVNVTSLSNDGYHLFIGEGDREAASPGHYRLLVTGINPGADDYRKFTSIKNKEIQNAPFGISGLTLGPIENALFVGVPGGKATPNGVGLPGHVLIFDLGTLDFKTGAIAPPLVVTMPKSFEGISPWAIYTGASPWKSSSSSYINRLGVINSNQADQGLSWLMLSRDKQDHIIGAKIVAASEKPPTP